MLFNLIKIRIRTCLILIIIFLAGKFKYELGLVGVLFGREFDGLTETFEILNIFLTVFYEYVVYHGDSLGWNFWGSYVTATFFHLVFSSKWILKEDRKPDE
jgi:hypothetical protein